MTKLADRLFHRTKHEVPVSGVAPAPTPGAMAMAAAGTSTLTSAPVASTWAIAPRGVCDVCSASLDGEHGRRVPVAQFTRAVQRGYDPIASGRVPGHVAAMLGIRGDAYTAWREMALGAGGASDWALCDMCADDLAAYIAGH